MVFAASAVTTLVTKFNAKVVIFTGVAGGMKPGQQIGDIVVGKDVVNYEMDVRGWRSPFEPDYIYSLGENAFLKWRFYEADPQMLRLALEVQCQPLAMHT